MTGKKRLFFVFTIILITSTIVILGCKSTAGNTIANNTAVDNTIADNTITDNIVPGDGKSFPLSIRGTWKKDNVTLIFTQDTLKASNQSYTWIFQSVSGDVYTIKPGNYNYKFTITVKLNNGDLEISGDSAVDKEHNWNGIWKKQ